MKRVEQAGGAAGSKSTDRTFLRLIAATSLVLCGVCGCVAPYKVGVTETGTPQYERLAIAYQIQARAAGLPPALAQTAGRRASIVDSAGVSYDDRDVGRSGQTWSTATLRVEYPHPEGEAGMVRATLRLCRDMTDLSAHPREPFVQHDGLGGLPRPADSGDSWTSPESFTDDLRARPSGAAARVFDPLDGTGLHDEVWVLDFPRQQLDLMLIDLADSGFFDDQQRPDGGARLSVTIDRGQTAKPWSTEPRLDDLIHRVQREGWLVGFTSPDDVFAEAEVAQLRWAE